MDDFGQYKDLPDEIPALLVLGTQVTGRSRVCYSRVCLCGGVRVAMCNLYVLYYVVCVHCIVCVQWTCAPHVRVMCIMHNNMSIVCSACMLHACS